MTGGAVERSTRPRPLDFAPLQRAIDVLTDTLLSHLSYERLELVEPLARLGFYTGRL